MVAVEAAEVAGAVARRGGWRGVVCVCVCEVGVGGGWWVVGAVAVEAAASAAAAAVVVMGFRVCVVVGLATPADRRCCPADGCWEAAGCSWEATG